MSEVLEAKLVEYLQKTESFVISETPEFVRQSINYYFYENLLCLILGLFLIVFTSTLLFNAINIFNFLTTKKYWSDNDAGTICVIGSVVSFFVLFLSFLCSFGHILSLIKICVAPNLYLLEKLVQ